MERLTTCKEITPQTDMTKEYGYSHIYKRLAEYENCGRTPEEVNEICKSGGQYLDSVQLAEIACALMTLRKYQDAKKALKEMEGK